MANSVSVTVDADGPLFNGSAKRIVADLRRDIEKSVAAAAMSELHHKMDQSFRNPTPYYETQVVQDRQVDSTQIHDRDIVYGPWLEGVSSRNRRSRFKGYKMWRRTTQEIDERVPEIVRAVVRRGIGRLGG